MSPRYARSNAIIPIVAAVSLIGCENFFYKRDAANKAILCTATTDIPDGLILDVSPDGMEISGAPLGGNHGTCRVKLAGPVTDLRKLLAVNAASKAIADPGSTVSRVLCAKPLETGATDEAIECILLPPPSLIVGVP